MDMLTQEEFIKIFKELVNSKKITARTKVGEYKKIFRKIFHEKHGFSQLAVAAIIFWANNQMFKDDDKSFEELEIDIENDYFTLTYFEAQ